MSVQGARKAFNMKSQNNPIADHKVSPLLLRSASLNVSSRLSLFPSSETCTDDPAKPKSPKGLKCPRACRDVLVLDSVAAQTDMHRQTDRQTNGQTDKRTDGQADRQADRQTNRRTDGQRDRWTDGQMDRRMHGQTSR